MSDLIIVNNHARAYVNHGRVIADCVHAEDCGSAMLLQPKQVTFVCGGSGGCGQVSPIEWPSDIDEILAALQARQFPKYRNWYPKGHRLAIRAGCPHGQTPDELRAETAENTKGSLWRGQHQ